MMLNKSFNAVAASMACATLVAVASAAPASDWTVVGTLDSNLVVVDSNIDMNSMNTVTINDPNWPELPNGGAIVVSDGSKRHRFDCMPALTGVGQTEPFEHINHFTPLDYTVNPYQYQGKAYTSYKGMTLGGSVFANENDVKSYPEFVDKLDFPQWTWVPYGAKWYDVPGKCATVTDGHNPAAPTPVCEMTCRDTRPPAGRLPFEQFYVEVTTGVAPDGKTQYLIDYKLYRCNDIRDLTQCVPADDDIISA